ncbi:hypothetical protein [Actinomadura sp. GTD37]|uniref:hypothetical protein n=1 Tax=Actinomadura sp. GTD37 TaxID=1778030 RepID=UPI0035BF1BFE
MEPNVPSSLLGKLNQSTPHAPGDADEAAERLAATRSAPPPPGTSAGAAASRPPVSSGEAAPGGLSSVYVPTTRPVGPGEKPEYQLRALEDGSAGIAVYTSADRLVECLGVDQPWSEASLLELLYLVGKKRIGVALNPRLDPGLTGTPAMPWAGS